MPTGEVHLNANSITSATREIRVVSHVDMNTNLNIESVLKNYEYWKTSLRIGNPNGFRTYVALSGSRDNTFTGVTTLEGINVELNLIKSNGVTAISGDLHVRDGAVAKVHARNQIKRNATISLISNGNVASTLRFASVHYGNKNLEENVHQLVIEGKGVIDFGTEDNKSTHGKRYFYMDDLLITEGSLLTILAWEEGRDHFLVRKDSYHLKESLKRLEFKGYDRSKLNLVDFNTDYWEISGAPEPATYGAGLLSLGLGFVLWRKKRLKMARSLLLREAQLSSR